VIVVDRDLSCDDAHRLGHPRPMILIGQYDSPFVRRVAIALALRGLAFEHRPWSTFREADKFRHLGPLTKVPTLALDDGTVLVDSHLILDWLEREAGGRSLWPADPVVRRRAMALAGLATGTSDVTVSLFYERALHPEPSPVLVARRSRQMLDGLGALESAVAAMSSTWLAGEAMGHVDIAVAVTWRFASEGIPDLVRAEAFPALAAFGARAEALPVFAAHAQAFIPPA
jgi:glutathione S-transferase